MPRRYTPVSDESTPDTQGELFVNNDATTSSPTDAPQYSSRRELRSATASDVRRNVARSTKPSRAAKKLARELSAAQRPPKASGSTGSSSSSSRRNAAKKQSPFVVLLALLAIPAFIGTTTIPAFAFPTINAQHESDLQKTADADAAAALPAQVMSVKGKIKTDVLDRAEISATSVTDLAAQKAAAQAILASANAPTVVDASADGQYSKVASRAAGDDYPWPTAGNTLSPLNYYYRQCVDFVAWRLNRDAGSTSAPFKYNWSNLTPNGGNASEWRAAWQAHGWKTSTTPIVGSVAWFNGNHVAYVKAVNGASVTIEEYNGMVSLGYAIRTIPTNSIPSYLYPPPR